MKKTGIICSAILSFLFSSCMNKNSEQDLQKANNQFYSALNIMFTGDGGPIDAIWAHENNITYLGPFGGYMTGWEAIGEEFKKNAAMKLGGKIVCKDLYLYPGKEIAYTVCVEEGENINAEGKIVKVSHRATNIFKRINGEYKMVHHHTDLSPQLETAFDKEIK